ncbi:hypothetical protein EJ110_NYTH18196 [Nymphaea thermarum]|nr:hypothetical protein EJ110_NYTH18196 [Nymphaea thermarum]
MAMEVAGDFCSSEAVALRQMAASLVEAVAVEAVLVAQKSVYVLLAMGSLLNGRNFLDQESEKSQGFDDSILIGMEDKMRTMKMKMARMRMRKTKRKKKRMKRYPSLPLKRGSDQTRVFGLCFS